MQRLLPARLLSSPRAVALLYPLRSTGTGEVPGSKTPHIDIAEDDRWLEAEIAEKFKTPEERYAHERQRQVMRALIQKLRKEHDEKLQKAVDDREEKVQHLQNQIKDLQKAIDDINSK